MGFKDRIVNDLMEQAEATDEDGEYHPEVDPPDFVKMLAEKARGDTVSAERLIGDGHYFYNVINHLNENEVPHYLFPSQMVYSQIVHLS